MNSLRRRSRILVVATAFASLGYTFLATLLHTSSYYDERCIPLPDWCVKAINTNCVIQHLNPNAHYHKLVDCIAPQYVALKLALSNESCIISCGTRCEVFKELRLLNEQNQSRFFEKEAEYCFDKRPVIELPAPKDVDVDIRRHGALWIAEDVAKIHNVDIVGLNVLLVNREGTRSFESKSFEKLTDSITSLIHPTGGLVTFYHGNETGRQTMKLFRRADAIIAYHGAAAGNLLFSRPQVIFLELSTYTDLSSKYSWRTNTRTLLPIRPDIISIVHFLPLNTITSSMTLDALAAAENKDQFVKGLQNISIIDSELEKITLKLKVELSKHWNLSIQPNESVIHRPTES